MAPIKAPAPRAGSAKESPGCRDAPKYPQQTLTSTVVSAMFFSASCRSAGRAGMDVSMKGPAIGRYTAQHGTFT